MISSVSLIFLTMTMKLPTLYFPKGKADDSLIPAFFPLLSVN